MKAMTSSRCNAIDVHVSKGCTTTCPIGNQGDYAQAEPLYVRATEITENALGPDHHEVAAVLKDRADMYVIQVRR